MAHTSAITVTDARLRVGQKGRATVIATGHKNVHAGIYGHPSEYPHHIDWNNPADVDAFITTTGLAGATYNPYQHSTFIDRHTRRPVTHSRLVHIGPVGVLYTPP